MRYYTLSVRPPHTSEDRLLFSSYVTPQPGSTSYLPGGSPISTFDAGALNILFTITNSDLSHPDGPTGGASITIQGVDITTVNQASDMQGYTLMLNAGMGKGLPLSKPEQEGTLLHGTIKSSLGQWKDTNMSITFFVTPYVAPADDNEKLPFFLHCQEGQPIKDSIPHAFRSTMYGNTIKFSSSENPIARHDITGSYTTSKELCVAVADTWFQHTQNRLSISTEGKFISFIEEKTHNTPHTIEFEDLIGQPTWNGTGKISIQCPLRGDIKVGDMIHISEATLELGSFSDKVHSPQSYEGKKGSIFLGFFRVQSVKHQGNFRSPTGENWMTTLDCIPLSYSPETKDTP